ncbi:unnamed protein product [Owenia fusiformis]|uniref:Uncharacterized protein n=1 Tax=Owenia fusiformis TaxID=6347 RepID=A0A8S4PTK1_OWEFU|nr:unnamed protein product [Owenia fusiformis]
MSFSTTFRSMLSQDIRHTHYGTPLNMTYRESSDFPTLDELRRDRDDKYLKKTILLSRTSSYYGRPIEPAPAFRVVSRYELEAIIKRVTKPQNREVKSKEDDTTSAPTSPRPMTSEDNAKMLTRLSTPTHMSNLRSNHRNASGLIQMNKTVMSKLTEVSN